MKAQAKGFYKCRLCGKLTGEANPLINGLCYECLNKEGKAMTPSQAEWRKLQRMLHTLQEWCQTPDERRMLAEVLTFVEEHIYKEV